MKSHYISQTSLKQLSLRYPLTSSLGGRGAVAGGAGCYGCLDPINLVSVYQDIYLGLCDF